jgi:hypothetical protein
MVCEKEEVSISPIDAQPKRNEDGAEDYQCDDWYLDGVGTVVQRKASRRGGCSHGSWRSSAGTGMRREDLNKRAKVYSLGILVSDFRRCYAVVVPCTTWAGVPL